MKKEMRINSVKLGIAGGIFWALLVLLVSIFSNHFSAWTTLFMECYGFIGYNPATFFGNVLGLVYGFVDGFIGLFVIAWIYNLLGKK